MYKMDLPVDPKEQQKIDLTRRKQEERKARAQADTLCVCGFSDIFIG